MGKHIEPDVEELNLSELELLFEETDKDLINIKAQIEMAEADPEKYWDKDWLARTRIARAFKAKLRQRIQQRISILKREKNRQDHLDYKAAFDSSKNHFLKAFFKVAQSKLTGEDFNKWCDEARKQTEQ